MAERARRTLEGEPECAERGFLIWLDAAAALDAGDLESALVGALQIQELGHRFTAPALGCLWLVTEGMIAIRRGQVDRGFALLDEAMLPVLAAPASGLQERYVREWLAAMTTVGSSATIREPGRTGCPPSMRRR